MTWIASFLLSVKGFFLKNKYAVILTGIVLILLWIICLQKKTIDRKNKEIAVAEHNLAAANDTIRLSKDREGRIEANKLSFLVAKLSDLEKANADLAREVKATKGKVDQISNIGFKIIHDTVEVPVKSEVREDVVTSTFGFDTTYTPGNFRSLHGYTKYNLKTGLSTGSITKDEFGVKLVTGIKNLNAGKPEIFVRSDYPGFVVTQLDGAVLDPDLFKTATKKKVPLVTLGINVGWTPMTYDWQTKQLDVNLQRVGVTAGFNFNLGRIFK